MYHAANRLSPDDVYHTARMAFLEMLAAGNHDGRRVSLSCIERRMDRTTRSGIACAASAGRSSRLRDPDRVAGDGVRSAGWKKDPDPGQIRFLSPTPDDFLGLMEAVGTGAQWHLTVFARCLWIT
jgi:hypothetical protein